MASCESKMVGEMMCVAPSWRMICVPLAVGSQINVQYFQTYYK